MALIRGYDVEYINNGSLKAYRKLPTGQVIDTVPVAWDEDWSKATVRGGSPTLIVWFKNLGEVKQVFAGGKFVAAVARKRPNVRSSKDIAALFEVEPIELHTETGGLVCSVIKACDPAEVT